MGHLCPRLVAARHRQPTNPVPSPALLGVLLHDAERVIDHQIQAVEELDDKSEHMIGLAVALLAGGLSLALFAVSRDHIHPDAWFYWMLLGAGVVNLVGIVAFLESYIGFRRGVEVHVGPSLAWIQTKAQDNTWGVSSHYLSLLSDEGYPAYYKFNLAKMLHSAGARRFGLLTLAGSVLLYTVALVYLLAQAI